MRVDMHMHTSASFDSVSRPDAVLAAARRRGIDVVCITDHNEVSAALRLRDAHPDAVIVGEEVKTREGVDVIGLFLAERIPARTPALETCILIHEQGGLVYMPHPFAGGKGGGGRLLDVIGDHIDIVEGHNARIHSAALNERAVRWAAARGIPVGAGSDAHTLAEVGRAWVETPDCVLEPAAFLQAVRRGTIHGTLSSRAVHLGSVWARLRKRWPGA
jgi:predicted metal-dependent phosphoesterase TrpH